MNMMNVAKELKESVLQVLAETDEAVLLLDKDGLIRYANEAAFYILDVDPLVGRQFTEVCVLFDAKERQMTLDIVSEAIKNKESVEFPEDICLMHTFGEKLFFKGGVTPLLDERGRVYGCRVRLVDITAAKCLEAQLKAERSSVNVMFGAAGVGMVVLNDLGMVISLNAAAEKILNRIEDGARGLLFGDAFACINSHGAGCGSTTACEYCPVRTNIQAAILNDSFSGQFTVLMRRKSNAETPMVWIKIFVSQSWENGRKQIILALIDISERKRREQELEKARIAAESASRAKDQFLANMSHEIRTPINGMTGMIELTLQSQLTEEQKEYLLSAKQCSEYLLRIINDILDYSKLESGKMILEEIRYELRDVIGHVFKVHEKIATGKKLYLKSYIDDDLPTFVRGDPLRIRQILHNLISNALKFTAKGGITINVTLEKEFDEKMIKIVVQDTGIGMEKKDIDKLFKAFSQVDGSTTRRFGGTGLGLMIVKNLILAMHGEIHVESEPNVGSSFIFTIPCIEESEADEEIRDKTMFTSPHTEFTEEEEPDEEEDILELLKYCEAKLVE